MLFQLGLFVRRMLKFFLLALFYLAWTLPTPFLFDYGIPLPSTIFLVKTWEGWIVRQLILSLFLAIAYWVWRADKGREERGDDDFSGWHLFYRYGEQIFSTAIPIPTDASWSAEETSRFAVALRTKLTDRIRQCLPEGAAHVLEPHRITNLDTHVKRDFIRILARSERGSCLVYFIYYAPYGSNIIAQYFTYRRGHHSSWDVVKLVLESPISLWFWIIPWLSNRYSLALRVSHLDDDPYDLMDLDTMYVMTQYISLKATEAVLAEAGLLTEEVQQILVNNITNVTNKNSQRFNISGGFVQSVGNVNQAVA
jgi:hypothetical protein